MSGTISAIISFARRMILQTILKKRFGGNVVGVANGMNLALKQRLCLANVRWNHVSIAKEIEEN